MKVVLAGGSGHLGGLLARAGHDRGDEVVVLGRAARRSPWRRVVWDGATLGPWASELEGADAVVNLAGRSVDCRYTPRRREEILRSRVDSTRVVGEAIARASEPPRAWLQMSTATIYAHRFDAPNDEATGVLGGGERDAPSTWRFSIDVARAWERALADADTPRTRKVALRTAMVMSEAPGGPFRVLLGLVRAGLGGSVAGGGQWMSWIHGDDFVRAVRVLSEREDLAGPVNVAAPHPATNADFMRALRAAWGTRVGLPASRWMVEIGTRLLGTESELVIKSRRVVPARLLASGFTFEHPEWPEAARDLVTRWRAACGRGQKASAPA